jgi:hypothetical protein
VPLVVSGNIDVENAPAFLELGAAAAIVDRGVFPDGSDEDAGQIITMRAVALTEVCADALGTPARISFTDLRSSPSGPRDSSIADLFDGEVAPEEDGSVPLFDAVTLEESDTIALPDPED